MRLFQIHEGMWPVYRGEPSTEPYTVYVDMDGVLVDLAGGLQKSKHHWKDPRAIVEVVGNIKDPNAVLAFYLGLKKTAECDAIWKAAAQRAKGGKLIVLTAVPPQRYGIVGLDQAKWEWCLENLDPTPDDIMVVAHGTKDAKVQNGALDILVDDDADNIHDWNAAGGTGIIHMPGQPRFTVAGLTNPGKMGVEIDMKSDEGVSTALPPWRGGGGRNGTWPRYRMGKTDHHMTARALTVPIEDLGPDEEPYKMDVLAVYSGHDKTAKTLIDVLKKDLGNQTGLQDFINQSCDAAAHFLTTKFKADAKPDSVHMPESSSGLTKMFADGLAQRLSLPAPLVWMKNRDPSSVVINPKGAQEYAQAMNLKKNQPNPMVQVPRGDPLKYQWTAEHVIAMWKRKGEAWVRGDIKTKQLDKYIRRGNLLNLYTPPVNPAVLEGTRPLIIDDITTFQMTIANMARTMLNAGSELPIGTVMWLFEN